ncbi:hypothetical protein GTY58_33980 [Streptomyces sp. SID5469]|nr:hypothetical protein [Streptomyces sp. SID5469]
MRLPEPEVSGGAVAAVRGTLILVGAPTGPRATRVSATRGGCFRPRSAHTSTRTYDRHVTLTRCSLVRRSRVAGSGTRIIEVRRILLGHSLPSTPGNGNTPARLRNNKSSSVR